MSKKRRFVFGCLSIVALSAITIAIPAVRWPLIGWWRGEPTWQRRPVSWWQTQIQNSNVSSFLSQDPRAAVQERKVLCRLSEAFEWPNGSSDLSGERVLLLLLDDPNPKLRYYAAERLGGLEQTSPAIMAALRARQDDPAPVIDDVTVGSAVARALKSLADRSSTW